jgi:hypothetical protein
VYKCSKKCDKKVDRRTPLERWFRMKYSVVPASHHAKQSGASGVRYQLSDEESAYSDRAKRST